MKRRAAVEPVIGHRMDRNLKGQDGDRINAVLTGRWFQLPPLLRRFAALLRAGDEPHQQRWLSVSRRVDLAEAPVEETPVDLPCQPQPAFGIYQNCVNRAGSTIKIYPIAYL
jgi:hypothetical protein